LLTNILEGYRSTVSQKALVKILVLPLFKISTQTVNFLIENIFNDAVQKPDLLQQNRIEW